MQIDFQRSFASLAKLSNLQQLLLVDAQVTDLALEGITLIKSLINLSVAENQFISDYGISLLPKLLHLENLDISGNGNYVKMITICNNNTILFYVYMPNIRLRKPNGCLFGPSNSDGEIYFFLSEDWTRAIAWSQR